MERKEVFQYQQTMSVPREKFIRKVIENKYLTQNDLRVCLLLLTELDGWDQNRKVTRAAAQDPENFKRVDVESIADALKLKKKEVKESIKVLEYHDIIESGETRAAKVGYRFTF